MSNRVTHSASSAATALFGTVTTTAHAFSTGIQALGNLAEELNLRSEERLHNVREDIKHDRIHTDTTRRLTHSIRLSKTLKEASDELARDPKLKAHYDEAVKLFAQLDAPANSNSNSNS